MLPTRATKGGLASWRSGPRAAVVSGLATLVLLLALGECVISGAAWAPEAFSRNELPVPGLLGDYFPNQNGELVLPDAVPTHSYRFTTNAEGYRGPLVTEQKPEGSFRVLALGDSYTWGDGVDDGDVWVRLFEQRLNRCARAEVINAGYVGRDTRGEADYLDEKGLRFSPDLVVLGAEAGDAMDIFEPYRDWDNREAVRASSRPAWLVRMLGPFSLGKLYFGSRIARRARAVERPSSPEGAWQVVEEQLSRMAALCEDAGSAFQVFGIAPSPDEEAWPSGRLAQAASAVGLSFVDLDPLVNERGPGPGWWAIPGDGHYTTEGNAVLAEVIYDQLVELGHLPERFVGECAGPSALRGTVNPNER